MKTIPRHLPSDVRAGPDHPLRPQRNTPLPGDKPESHHPHGETPLDDAPPLAPLFSWNTLKRDAPAGLITGLMAVPLTVGICLMSEYPIQIGLLTVVAACCVSFLCYLVRPGNHVGVPGIAAGLAPVLAMGIHHFGMQNMPWLIFLTSMMQALVWRYRLEGYILKVVPPFLIEGLLAGVGLKIALKFLPHTWESVNKAATWSSPERLIVIALSVAAFIFFVVLYNKFKNTSPGLPYVIVIAAGIVIAQSVSVPMLHVEPVDVVLRPPFPDFSTIAPRMHVEMVLYAAMLMLIDVIEQVMSNAAIEKIDPLGRKSDSNNSLWVMWLGNAVSSFFGGMTNLDGLAKSSTNRMAGAVTKMSALFVAAVLGVVLAFPHLLTWLPEFALAVLMIFTGWKMIAGLVHVAAHGKYGFGLALMCGLLVFRLGIFEGLLISLAVHSFITYVIYRHEHVTTIQILKKFLFLFTDVIHPHSSSTLHVVEDPISGGQRYRSVTRAASDKKSLDAFIQDWSDGINHKNLLGVVGCYDTQGMLWGTFAKELRSGHTHIKHYFEHLFALDHLQVTFDSSEIRHYGEIYIKSGSYHFSYMRKETHIAVPARYSFVCKKEKTGWYIVEHHSSEFPA